MSAADPFLAEARAVLQKGDARSALNLIAEAATLEPDNPEVWMARCVCCRAIGDLAAAREAAERALALEPYHFFARLSLGAITEKTEGARAAARIYRDALKIAPPPERMPPALRSQAEHAAQVVSADSEALAAHITARLGEAALADAPFRFRESVNILLGRAKPQPQVPLYFHYPQLPAIPYYPRDLFPWLGEVEAATSMIQAELAGALDAAARDFSPYIQFPKGAPVNQWAELNHSERWSTLHLWRDGKRIAAACERFPRTSGLMERLPIARQTGFAPTVMFSRLDPHTRIPPHTGSTNVRLIAHLPLVLPGLARFRVGNETREWKLGEAWVFDDTIEHEAWNDADAARIILIFDVWNPFLNEQERELVTALLLARREYYAN